MPWEADGLAALLEIGRGGIVLSPVDEIEVADLSGDVVLLHRGAAELAGGGELQRLRRHQDDSAIGPAGASNGGRHALAQVLARRRVVQAALQDRKSTRLNSSH